MRPPAPDPGPPPTEDTLRAAALAYLARYSATQSGLLQVLTRRVQRWARRAGMDSASCAPSLAAARKVVTRLAALGVIDDALFTATRVKTLQRAGRSRRAISAHLQAKGVPADLAVIPEDAAAELAAALLYIARRRMGPFRSEPDAAARPKEAARLARAGFPARIAYHVLDLSPEDAEDGLLQARRRS